ncbi:MAG TPA: phage tail length tape measure family protein, partial [Thiohalobacter sp.]|nr:phage tail length tape measure family protein [Thiohalobacter sp.]
MARDLSLALRIRADANDARKQVREIRKELRAAGRTGKRAGRDLQPFGSSLDRIRASAVSLRGVLVGLGAITLFRSALRNTVRQEQALRQVENRLRETGNAVGFTTDELARMASELQSVTTVGDEEILELQNQLLAFGNITGEQFERTLSVILDFAEATGRNASSAIRTLGVAVNDPVSGMARLRQAGIDLDESQKALITSLSESGDSIGAQRVLLDALETAYGGAARTARDTLGGAISGLQNAFGDLLEAPGGMQNMQAVLELITESIKGLQEA